MNRFKDIILAVLIVVCIVLGLREHRMRQQTAPAAPPNIVAQITPEARVVTVPGPIVTKTVTKFLSDPADKALIDSLLKENSTYKTKPNSITSTTGELVTEKAIEQTPGSVPAVAAAKPVTFKDWHLQFTTDGQRAQYKLDQHFVVLATTGRSASGQPLSLTKVFEVGPNGERLPVTNLQTEAVYTDETQPHLMIKPNVQLGVVGTNDGNIKGGLIGLQWLKRGQTNAPADLSFAFLTPVFVFNRPNHLGVLPFSWNVGRRLKPLSNLWISPYVSQTQIGVSVTGTI